VRRLGPLAAGDRYRRQIRAKGIEKGQNKALGQGFGAKYDFGHYVFFAL
jgi:hypothetical protein